MGEWKNIILTNNKEMIRGDFLIDPHPYVSKDQHVTWQHIIYDQPFNRSQLNTLQRMTDWREWKASLGLEDNPPGERFVHGSHDSQDIDVVYVFPELPSPSECRQFCCGVAEDRNLISIRRGFVLDCHRGSPDELTNSLFETLPLHVQPFPNPFHRKVRRVVPWYVWIESKDEESATCSPIRVDSLRTSCRCNFKDSLEDLFDCKGL